MKWLTVVLVLLGIVGNTPAGSLLPCPRSHSECKLACCVGAEVHCCEAKPGDPSENPLQAPLTAKETQFLAYRASAPVLLLLPLASERIPARSAPRFFAAVPSDRLAILCSFLI